LGGERSEDTPVHARPESTSAEETTRLHLEKEGVHAPYWPSTQMAQLV